MARIEPAVDYSTILRMKGILDYSTWRGVNYVRSWPRKSNHKRSAAEIAGSTLFTLATQSWRDQSPPVQDFYRLMVKGSTERALDLWTAQFTSRGAIIDPEFVDPEPWLANYVVRIAEVACGIDPANGNTRAQGRIVGPNAIVFGHFVQVRPTVSVETRVYRGRLCSRITHISHPWSISGTLWSNTALTGLTWPTLGPLAPITMAFYAYVYGPGSQYHIQPGPRFFLTFMGYPYAFGLYLGHYGDWSFP